jgi:hypothetical protein
MIAYTSLSAKAAERKLESQATITIGEARARALKVFPEKVMKEELEKEAAEVVCAIRSISAKIRDGARSASMQRPVVFLRIFRNRPTPRISLDLRRRLRGALR